jgi:c-di-GMP-binding flagellar brake protein YcgR
MIERRRFPRQTIGPESAIVPSTMKVALLDISPAGVLLHSSDHVETGSQGSLSLNLGGLPLKADVHVRRVLSAEPSAGYRLGASFVALSADQRRLIERFIAN